MSARDMLLAFSTGVPGDGYDRARENVVDAILDEHARELAAKQKEGADVSEYRHSGLGRADWEARHLLRKAIVLIEERWPGTYGRQASDLASLCELIEAEGRRDGEAPV